MMTNIFDKTGWKPWINPYPFRDPFSRSVYSYKRVYTMRDGWENMVEVDPSELPPEINIYGLYWLPVSDYAKRDG